MYDDFTVEQCIAIDLFERNNKIGRSFGNAPTSETLSRIAAGWLQKNHEKPFFMFVFYYDPHYDYSPPSPFDSIFDPNYDGAVDGHGIENESRKSIPPPQKDLDHIIALYDGEILYTDRHVSTLLEKFAEYEILDNTLIVVFGDHGEEFYEHGSTTHGHSLYTEVTHIPLIFRWPSVIPENRCVDALVSQVDVMPTILDYLDIEYKGFIQGDSLKPLINEQKEKLHNMVYAELSQFSNQCFAAIINQDYKFIIDLTTGEQQLFNLNKDRGEKVNIYEERSSNSPVFFESHLTQWLTSNCGVADKLSDKENLHKVELDQDQIRKLKTLGYLQ